MLSITISWDGFMISNIIIYNDFIFYALILIDTTDERNMHHDSYKQLKEKFNEFETNFQNVFGTDMSFQYYFYTVKELGINDLPIKYWKEKTVVGIAVATSGYSKLKKKELLQFKKESKTRHVACLAVKVNVWFLSSQLPLKWWSVWKFLYY